jgi:hypothetical protein
VGKWVISSIFNDEYIGPWLSQGVEWESWMRQDIEANYKQGTDILDIGGNIGCNALMFSDYGQVHTFEPLFHEILGINVNQNTLKNSVKIWPFGLSAVEGTQKLYMPKCRNGMYNYGCCSLQPDSDNHSDSSFLVQLKRLDDVYKGTPSVMKIDVEGHEMDVLKGAEETIRKHKPALIIEIHNFDASPIPNYILKLGYMKMIRRVNGNYIFSYSI